MSDKLSNTLKEQAILYALNELEDAQVSSFQRQMDQNPRLLNYVEEIKATFSLTSPLAEIKPTEELLQGQRNILRSQIEKINQAEASWYAQPLKLIQTVFSSLNSYRQPAWAIAAYMALAFFIGSYFSTNTIQQPELTPTNYPTVQELIQSGAIHTADIHIGKNDDPVQFALQASNEVNIAGNVEDKLIRDLLFYLLLNDNNPGNRLKAVKLMEQIEPVNESMMVILSSALTDPNPGVRLKSVRLLHQFNTNPTMVDACLKILLEEKNEAIRMEALSILSSSPSQEIVSTLRVVSLVDENDYIREQTARVLADMNEMYPSESIKSIQEN